jgi:hypothetical protein
MRRFAVISLIAFSLPALTIPHTDKRRNFVRINDRHDLEAVLLEPSDDFDER